jgi:hypothetical protein
MSTGNIVNVLRLFDAIISMVEPNIGLFEEFGHVDV